MRAISPAPQRRAPAALCALAAALAILLAVAAGPARAAHSPTPGPDAIIDGPSAAIAGVDGMSIARDGTGGLVYVKDVAGTAHVFASVLQNGSFGAPVQVDAGLSGPSSQPVVAAGLNGVLLIAFVNNGGLYVAGRGATGTPLGPPSLLYAGAANPSISMSNFGKAYLAFTATGGAGGGDVTWAFYYQGQWALGAGALDANPADAAGVGAGRPDVVCAGDGIGIVVWGENGHIFSRRVAGTTPSVVFEQADVPTLDGWQEVSARNPSVSAGGDSSYAVVAFQEELESNSAHPARQSRVLVNRLHGSQYDGVVEADGVATGGPEGADQPQAAANEYGEGWVTSEHDVSHQLFAAELGNNDAFQGVLRVDSLPNGAAADGMPGIAGLSSTFIAWQQTPGIAGPAEVRLRFAPNGSDLGPEQVLSSPSLGATDADRGLVTGGDTAGDAAVAWVQGSGAQTRIVAEQLFQPPGGFAPLARFAYSTSATPVLGWTASNELWGAPLYTVSIDGTAVGQTTAQQLTAPAPLSDGRHAWQAVAVNQAGVATAAPGAIVFVDTVAPRLSLRVTGRRLFGQRIHVRVAYSDPPPAGQPRSAASGVALVQVRWGDRSRRARIRRTTASHVYRIPRGRRRQRPRTFTITVTATDRAGNTTVVRRRIRIRLVPARHPRRRHRTRQARRAPAARQIHGSRR